MKKWIEMGKLWANRKNIANIVFWIMIILVSYVFVSASRWSFYSADDFSHANGVGVFGGNIFDLFAASVSYMIKVYKTWQGTYFSMFLQGFLSPINGYGEQQLSLVMVCNAILFILALILLIRQICTLIDMEKHLRTILSFFVLFSILGWKAWTEIFYWFSGAVSYSFPLSAAMLAIVLYLKNKNMWSYVGACLLTFFASGGSLEVAGISCFSILTILFVKGFKRLQKKDFIFFGIAVLGALINTAAPGNYIRRNVIDDSGLHFGGALIRSINQSVDSFEWLLFQTPFLLIVVLCTIIGFYIGGGKWFHKISTYKLIIMCAMMPVVTYFPVHLAYFNEDYFPNRCEFVGVCVCVIAIIIVSVLLGVFLKESNCSVGYREGVSILLFLCLVMPMINEGYRYSNTVVYRMYNNSSNDSFKRYHDSVNEIYKQIEENPSADVIIENLPKEVADFHKIPLRTDSENWLNKAIAKYYKKNTITLKHPE